MTIKVYQLIKIYFLLKNVFFIKNQQNTHMIAVQSSLNLFSVLGGYAAGPSSSSLL